MWHGCQGTPMCTRWLGFRCYLSYTWTDRHPGSTLMMSAARDPCSCSVEVYGICIIPQRDGGLVIMLVNNYLESYNSACEFILIILLYYTVLESGQCRNIFGLAVLFNVLVLQHFRAYFYSHFVKKKKRLPLIMAIDRCMMCDEA